ncbi:hypothetical protein V7S76_00750 [Aquirufa sp. ROCK2-A2]
MEKQFLNLSLMGATELSYFESISIEGGGFWKVLGFICGVAAIAALCVYAPVLIGVLAV